MRRSSNLIDKAAILGAVLMALQGCAAITESMLDWAVAKHMDKRFEEMSGKLQEEKYDIYYPEPDFDVPGRYSPNVYRDKVYREIRFPRDFRAGKVEIPQKHLNIVRNFQEQSLKLVNWERAKAGRKELKLNAGLSAYAMVRAKELTTKYSHERPNGKNALEYIGGGHKTENIARNVNGMPESFIETWMNDDVGGKDKILSPDAATMGIGVAIDKKDFVAAQLLGSERPTTPYGFKKYDGK